MDMFTKENIDIPAMYDDYSVTDVRRLNMRRITEREYGAVEGKYKNKTKLLLTRPGIIFAVSLFFVIAGIFTAIGMIRNNESDGWVALFVYAMLGLFIPGISFIALLDKMDRFVSDDAVVSAGEIFRIEIIRGPRNSVAGANHFIAIRGTKEIVMVRDNPPIPEGATVLIVRSPGMKYHIFRVPSYAADLDAVPEGHSYEIESSGDLPTDDYSKYQKVSLSQAGRHRISEHEYAEIPAKYRSSRPLGHGAESVCWAFFVMLAAGMLGGIFYSVKIHYPEALMVTLVGFFCSAVIAIIISPSVLQKQLPREMTMYIECTPIKKTRYAGHCIINAVNIEKKLYIENIEVDPAQFDEISENVPAKLYYSGNINIIKYVRYKYDVA